MKIFLTEDGYVIENESEELVVQSQPMGGKASTIYQGTEIMVKVKPTLWYFISPQFNILKNNKIIGSIKKKYWGGNFNIQFESAGQIRNYLLKTSSDRYELMDTNKESLLIINTNYSWKKLDHEFEVLSNNIMINKAYAMELAFYAMFSIYLCLAKGEDIIA